jgi:outer membrane biosynthesis protein TonB
LARPSPAIIGSIALHAGVGALLIFALMQPKAPPAPVTLSVPVSIISDTETILAGPADNPSEELVTDDASTAPVEAQPTPQPTPTPPPPTPAPSPRPQQRPPQQQPQRPPTPQRQQQQQQRPPQQRQEPSLDLDELAGPARNSRNQGTRPRTGQQGQGSAPRAVGQGDLRAIGSQVNTIWNCDLPGAEQVVVRVIVTLDEGGRIVGSPRLDRPRSDAAYHAISDSVIRAFRAAAPFDMPAGYQQQELSFVFPASSYC